MGIWASDTHHGRILGTQPFPSFWVRAKQNPRLPLCFGIIMPAVAQEGIDVLALLEGTNDAGAGKLGAVDLKNCRWLSTVCNQIVY